MRKNFRATHLMILAALTMLLCLYNFSTGYGEDPDSLRILEAGRMSAEQGRMIPSRSWGFPLYEAVVYSLLQLPAGIFLAKLLSLLCLVAAAGLMYGVFLRLKLAGRPALLLAILFLCNPMMIIAGNSIMETAMSVLLLVLILYISMGYLRGGVLTGRQFIVYGLLFGLANLVRPDNAFYFPALFLLAMLFKQFRFGYAALSVICFAAVGILPYYLLGYPVFTSLPGDTGNQVVVGVKNIAALAGLPFLLFLLLALLFLFVRQRHSLQRLLNRADKQLVYAGILSLLALIRSFVRADELEYSIYLWVMIVVLISFVIRQLHIEGKGLQAGRLLALAIITAFIPNLVQLYFFREVNFDYRFSVGITDGVLQQEKQRRRLRWEVFMNGDKVLRQASLNAQKPGLEYKVFNQYVECDSCIVMTTVRDMNTYRKTGGLATDSASNRLVYALDFNVSRGWRNFIKNDDLPRLSAERLQPLY